MSSAGELSATTFTGVDQEAERVARPDTQMSVAPMPPGRSEPNQRVSPSAEIAELVSNAARVHLGDGRRRARTAPVATGRRAIQTSPLLLTRSDVK